MTWPDAEIPLPIIRNVLGDEHARRLLLHLEGAHGPVRYARAREALAMHPETFRRALKALQDYALVQQRAPARGEGPKNAVYLEASILGHLFADLWREMNADLAKLMAERHIPASLLAAIAES